MVSLTKIEFALLELLLRNAEQVLSYDVILDRVWGYGEAPASNALQVFVGMLRRKLEEHGERRLVHNVRGVGYVLRAGDGVSASGALLRRRSWRRLFRQRLGLQTRFTLVAAGAVAATALAITAVAFLAIRTDLENQIQQQLTARAASVEHAADKLHGHIPDGWVPPHSNRFGVNTPYTQVITATGGVWTAGGNAGLLSPDAADLAVARGDSAAFFANRTVGGTRSAVLTTPLAPGLALQVAESLSTTDVEVASVGATLAVLSAIGIMAATVLGWAVARAGLAPVARLAASPRRSRRPETRAAGCEWTPGRARQARRVVQQHAERAAASLAAQRRLVSDASHELRTPLASLRVNVELLADDPGMPPAERQEVLNRVVDQVAELSLLVAGVTELARGETPAAGWGPWGPVRLDEVPRPP